MDARAARGLFECDVDHFLSFEKLVGKEVAEVPRTAAVAEGGQFALEVASFQTDESVGQGVALLAQDVLFDEAYELAGVHNGAAYDEVETAFFFHHVAMDGLDVLQADAFGYGAGYLDFLADAVHQVEPAFRAENGQWDAGKSAACAYVHDGGAGAETNHLGDAQTVQHVVGVEIVDVLAGDDVDLGIPFSIERIEGFELLFLRLGEFGEVVKNVGYGVGHGRCLEWVKADGGKP